MNGSRNAGTARSTSSKTHGSHVDDPRVVEALEEYLGLLKTGRRPTREEFLGKHASIAQDLRECLDGLDFVLSAASGLPTPSTASAADEALVRGSQLGDFRIVREVGRGGMGVVFEAEQLSLSRRVALKVLPFASAIDRRHRQRFHVEAQAAAQLQHQHIVPIYGVGSDRGIHYYAMQFIEGRTVAALIRFMRRSDSDLTLALSTREPDPATEPTGPYPLPEPPPAPPSNSSSTSRQRGRTFYRDVAELGRQAAEALEHAHTLGILHRDIKPANLMVDLSGHLWVTDFGLARISDDAGVTRTGDVLGTLRYMSPEQALGRSVLIDERTDVYSLGVTLYELLTLRPAFDATDRQVLLQQVAYFDPPFPSRADRSIPRDLETIVMKAMAKDPLSRYPTARDLADDLRRFLNDEPIRARRPSVVEQVVKWSRRHRSVVMTAALTVMLALPIATTLIWIEKGQTEQALSEVKTTREREREILRLTFDMSDRVTMQHMASLSGGGRASAPENTEFYQKALEFYEGLATRTRNDPAMAVMEAQAYHRIGFTRMILRYGTASNAFQRSIDSFEKVIASKPDDPELLEMFAEALRDYGYFLRTHSGIEAAEELQLRAVRLLDQATRAHPGEARFLLNLTQTRLGWAKTLAAEGRFAEARAIRDELRAHASSLATQTGLTDTQRDNLAQAYLRQGMRATGYNDRDEAIYFYELGLLVSPNDPYLLNALAWVLVERPLGPDCSPAGCWLNGSVRTGSAIFLPAPPSTLAAIAMSDRAVNAYPNRWEFVHTRGVAQYRAGLWDQAITTLTTSMELRRGGDPFEWFFLAMAEHQRGKTSEARRWFDRGENWFRRFPSPDPDIAPIRSEAAEVLGIPIDATVRERPTARPDRSEKTTVRRSPGWSGVVSILIPAIMAKSVGRHGPP